jgi:hypothetical protein
MLVAPTTTYDGGRDMRTSIRHCARAVDHRLMTSAVALPMRTRQRLLFFVIGIRRSGTLVLRRIAITHAYLPPQTTGAARHERRLRRVLNDPLLTWERRYARVVRRLLARQTARRWVVIIDEPAQAEHLRGLTAARWYRGRAIPLAWSCWPGQPTQPVAYWHRCGILLAQVAQGLPAGAPVVVVADRAFGWPVCPAQVAAKGGDWLVIVPGQPRWHDHQGRIARIAAQVAQRGERWTGAGQVFKDAGWRAASRGALWGYAHKGPLLRGSRLPRSWDLLAV